MSQQESIRAASGQGSVSVRFALKPLAAVKNTIFNTDCAPPRNCNADHHLTLTVTDFHKVGLVQGHTAHIATRLQHALTCALAR